MIDQPHETPPGVIPYVEHYTGARRVLVLDLTAGRLAAVAGHCPFVSIDGRRYLVIWGALSFEVPAERSVHVSVHVEADYVTQFASMLLPPGDGQVAFRYEMQALTGLGSLVAMS